eukprot:1142603-Pelagomonas_calceolata.AAC.1
MQGPAEEQHTQAYSHGSRKRKPMLPPCSSRKDARLSRNHSAADAGGMQQTAHSPPAAEYASWRTFVPQRSEGGHPFATFCFCSALQKQLHPTPTNNILKNVTAPGLLVNRPSSSNSIC